MEGKTRIKEFGPWTEQYSSSGKRYYYNKETEISQWEKPSEWRQAEKELERAKNKEKSLKEDRHINDHGISPKNKYIESPASTSSKPPMGSSFHDPSNSTRSHHDTGQRSNCLRENIKDVGSPSKKRRKNEPEPCTDGIKVSPSADGFIGKSNSHSNSNNNFLKAENDFNGNNQFIDNNRIDLLSLRTSIKMEHSSPIPTTSANSTSTGVMFNLNSSPYEKPPTSFSQPQPSARTDRFATSSSPFSQPILFSRPGPQQQNTLSSSSTGAIPSLFEIDCTPALSSNIGNKNSSRLQSSVNSAVTYQLKGEKLNSHRHEFSNSILDQEALALPPPPPPIFTFQEEKYISHYRPDLVSSANKKAAGSGEAYLNEARKYADRSARQMTSIRSIDNDIKSIRSMIRISGLRSTVIKLRLTSVREQINNLEVQNKLF